MYFVIHFQKEIMNSKLALGSYFSVSMHNLNIYTKYN